MHHALSVQNVRVDHPTSGSLLREVSFTVDPGDAIVISGPSGIGKSTLLHCAAGLLTPSQGQVSWGGIDLRTLSETEKSQSRRRMGFVFQHHHLLAEETVLENVMLPLHLLGMASAREQAWAQLDALGLASKAHHRWQVLSGGEQQRVAVARALVHQPSMVFADEPTGSLDPHSAQEVWRGLLQTTLQSVLVIVTHQPESIPNIRPLRNMTLSHD